MTQLDLFSIPATPKKPVEKPVLKREAENVEERSDGNITPPSIVEIAEETLGKMQQEPVSGIEAEQAKLPEPVLGRVVSPPSERTGDIIFEDSKITVKIKARQAPVKKEELIISPPKKENRGEEYPLPGKPASVEARRSIVTKQPKTAYSNSIREKLDSVKNSIKEGLLKDNLSEKKKNKEAKPQQKRGRKSFKEIDVDIDLVEIPEDEVLFQKQYYAISEVAGWFNVNTSLLRYWENEFDILKPRKNRKGDRLFRPEDVKNLQIIYQLLRQRKYSIEGAKEYLKVNKNKADTQMQLTNTLQKFKSFLLELKANLQE